MTKEERAEKEAREKADFERHMELLQATAPPSDSKLLKSVAAVSLSPAETLEPRAASVGPNVPTGAPEEEPPVVPVQDAPEVLSPSQRSAARLYASDDPRLESLLDAIAQQVKARRRPQSGPVRRVLVTVDSDVFSRISHVSHARRMNKIEVLSYLLARYLPEAGPTDPPAWIMQERPEEVINCFHLVYLEDAEIAERFSWLEHKFGLLKVDIVAAIVTRYLPSAPFVVPPKRRPRRKRL
ncbi:MAG: hypothetical protein WB586_09655 [Chthoniobacterales bacterium]